VNELAHQAVIDPDAESDRTVYATAFAVVVDASTDHETLAERCIGKRHTDGIAAGRMLPDAAPWLELEVLQHGGSHPKPWALRVADEAFGRRHRAVAEASARGTSVRPWTNLHAPFSN
jgi:hypothetical protein